MSEISDKKNLVKNLVIVRVGDDSLHESWLEGERNWDMLVSCFDDHPEKWQRDDVMHVFYKGGKFDGLYDAFQQVPGLLDKYDYIMMADDDFAMTAQDINRTFDIMRKYDLQIGQPSLTPESHCPYFPLYHHPAFEVRLTNFVEQSTVCMASVFWRRVLPLWEGSPHSSDVDFFWARLTDDPTKQVGIIDCVQITHTRPGRKGPLHARFLRNVNPVKYEVKKYTKPEFQLPIVCHAGYLTDGQLISGPDEILPFLVSAWHENVQNINWPANKSRQEKVKKAIQNQEAKKNNLSQVKLLIHGHEDKRKNLVIVCAGDESTHKSWLDDVRNWDIIVSCFGDRPQKWQQKEVMHAIHQGGKFDSIYNIFQQKPELLDKYEFILLTTPYDKMSADDINRIFMIMRKYNLQLGQPSLSHKSTATYFPIYHNPRFKIRFTNFVEAETTCVSTNVFRQILPLYQENPLALGVDFFWTRLADNPARQAAIIDEVQITRDQPIQANRDKIKKYGWPEEGPVHYTVPDFEQDLGKWDLPKIACHAAIRADNQLVSSQQRLLPMLVSDWIKIAQNIDRSQMFLSRPVDESMFLASDNQAKTKSNRSKTKIIIYGHKDKIRARNISKLENSDRKNLVIVRAGDSSWHEEWLEGERNWDMLVSCFNDHPEKWQRDDVMHVFYKGGKFDGLYDAFQQVPGLLDKYDYIMMADDDFAMTAQDINRTFDIMRKYDLQLGQPSLSHESTTIYFSTYHNPSFKVRFTNFVEAGVVCMIPSIWKQVLPIWKGSPHALGVDFFWARLTNDPARQVGIIDAVQVSHFLPRYGGLHKKFQKIKWANKYAVKNHIVSKNRPAIVCHGGWTKKEKQLKGRRMASLFLCWGWLKSAKKFDREKTHGPFSITHHIYTAIKEQIFGAEDLSKTEVIVNEYCQ